MRSWKRILKRTRKGVKNEKKQPQFNGIAFFLKVKTEQGKLTPNQKTFLEAVNKPLQYSILFSLFDNHKMASSIFSPGPTAVFKHFRRNMQVRGKF